MSKTKNTTIKTIEQIILKHLHGRPTPTLLTQIHAQIIRHNLHQSNHILSHFITTCGSHHKMSYAHQIFNQTHHPNILLYNSMIKGYSNSPPFHGSIEFFCTMKNNGIWADEFSYGPVLKSCANVGGFGLRFGEIVHGDVLTRGFCLFGCVGVGLVEMYVSFGRMGDAMKMFDEMCVRDGVSVVVGNMVVKGWCKDGNVDMGLRVFRGMRVRSVVSWNTILSCLAKSGREREALGIFREMLDDGVDGDEGTVVSMLPVCARLGEDGVGEWIHAFVKSSGVYDKYVSVRNSVVDFYCKRGRLDDAFLVFEDMPGKNVVSWNAMISGLAFNGDGEKGLALYDEMIKKGFKPNESTFVGVLTCCVHSGLVQRGKDLFALMVSKHHVEPKLEHYGCMVDLLGRGGLVKEAFDLVKSMPVKPNAALWGALLSSCRDHGYMEIAEVAVKELIVLEPWNSGNYVLLSNMYAERGKWDEVEKVRVLMTENNIEKNQGQSLIRSLEWLF